MNVRCGVVRIDVRRGGRVESHHVADFAIAGPGDATFESVESVFLRSSAKPFQAAAVIAAGAADRFGFSDEEIAIMAASHSGEDRHTAIVAGLLAKIGATPDALACGVHPPFDAATAARLGDRITALHHNCSGKHAGMIALALHLGFAPGSYLDAAGAVQYAMRDTVALACGLSSHEVVIAIDGCSAATFAVPLGAGARAFSLLARPSAAPAELRAPLERVVAAMRAHPQLVGGGGRFDTRLMSATGARLVSKAGAEGVQGVADTASGRGFCLKGRDGTARAVAPATLEALRDAGWIAEPELATLRDEWQPAIMNFTGKRVGEIAARIATKS